MNIGNAIAGFMKVMLVPVILMNWIGILVGAVWLAILGHWGTLGIGVLSFFVSKWIVGIAIMPSMIFAAPAAALMERGKMIPGLVLGGLSNVYLVALFTAWCVLVYYFFMQRADSSSMWPILLWSYAVATFPITALAHHERDNVATTITAMFVDLGCIVMIVMIAFFRVTVIDVAIGFAIVMAVSLAVNWYTLYEETRYKQWRV